jgi:hypothetical protein
MRTAATSAYRAVIRRQHGASRKAAVLGTVCPAFLLVTL